MDKNYTFEHFWLDLKNGYQIYFTYMKKRYLISKLKNNCYSKELVDENKKGPEPNVQIITLKSVKEMFPYMEEFEYKVDTLNLM